MSSLKDSLTHSAARLAPQSRVQSSPLGFFCAAGAGGASCSCVPPGLGIDGSMLPLDAKCSPMPASMRAPTVALQASCSCG